MPAAAGLPEAHHLESGQRVRRALQVRVAGLERRQDGVEIVVRGWTAEAVAGRGQRGVDRAGGARQVNVMRPSPLRAAQRGQAILGFREERFGRAQHRMTGRGRAGARCRKYQQARELSGDVTQSIEVGPCGEDVGDRLVVESGGHEDALYRRAEG